MEDTLISFETAKLAKEKGFNWKCLNVVDNQEFELLNPYYSINSELIKTACTRPTQSLLQKWLREVHNIHIDIRTNAISNGDYFFYLFQTRAPFYTLFVSEKNSDDYEKALEYALKESLKLIK